MDVSNVIMSWLHEIATVVWIGALVLNVLVLMPAMKGVIPLERYKLTTTIIRRFTYIAIVSVLVLIVTGVGLTGRSLGANFMSLVLTTTYGQLLLAKSIAMASMVVIGCIVGLGIEPRIKTLIKARTAEGDQSDEATSAETPELVSLHKRLRILVVVEMILGVVVLLLAAILPQV